MLRRREFIRRAAVAAALLGLPLARAEQLFAQDPPALPPRDLYGTDPDRYWAELRRQWLLAADRINLNCGSVGCTPLPVLRAMIDHLLSAEEFREAPYPWFGYEENTRLRELRDALAAFLHVKRDELAIVRNATEANNVVCNGLDLKPGDEALLTDQEHPGGRCCWEQKAARFGVELRYVTLPKPPASKEQIVELFARAITPRTRILVFSHITTVTGVILPVKEICALARSRGILTHVDGAHAIGQIPLDLYDLGCDFYATSPHKWLMSPKGTGTLYVREELLERLWVNTVTTDWRNYALKAYRFSTFGTSNLSVMVGLKAALDFFHTIGPERIYARLHQLATRVRDRVAAHAQVQVVNASKDEFFGGLVSFEPVPRVAPGATTGGLQRVADECAARNIRIAGGPERIRIATHIFTQPTDLSAFFDALDAGLRA
ncbi:MAG: aminotransferase class V-fold PLP-dependent enzyme [Acidobacteria bacterium]|nr:aminotransferase class V-fold PLP-dependent enzyme [Acidobacteriota bacterium]